MHQKWNLLLLFIHQGHSGTPGEVGLPGLQGLPVSLSNPNVLSLRENLSKQTVTSQFLVIWDYKLFVPVKNINIWFKDNFLLWLQLNLQAFIQFQGQIYSLNSLYHFEIVLNSKGFCGKFAGKYFLKIHQFTKITLSSFGVTRMLEPILAIVAWKRIHPELILSLHCQSNAGIKKMIISITRHCYFSRVAYREKEPSISHRIKIPSNGHQVIK